MKLRTMTALLACALALPVQAGPGGSAKSIVLRTLQGENTGMDGMQISFLLRNQDGSLMPRDHKYPFYTSQRFKVKVIGTADGSLAITNIDPAGQVTALLTQTVRKGVEAIVPARNDQFFEFEGPGGDERLKFELTPNSYTPPTAAQPAVARPVSVQPTVALPPPVQPVATLPVSVQPAAAINVAVANPSPYGGAVTTHPASNSASSPYSNVSGKSIRLVTTSDGSSDYLVRPAGTGTLVQEITIKHQ